VSKTALKKESLKLGNQRWSDRRLKTYADNKVQIKTADHLKTKKENKNIMLKGEQDLNDDHALVKQSDKAKPAKEISDRTISEIESNQ
jgi:hypothetical protein